MLQNKNWIAWGVGCAVAILFVASCATMLKTKKKRFVCAVRQVQWVGVMRNDGKTNLEVGVNPANRGGGDRIFPGRNHPSGTAGKDDRHDRVRIRVTLVQAPPVGVAATIHFKLFDGDHYSADATFDPNGVTAPDDNVTSGEPLTLDIAAQLRLSDFSATATSATLVGNGVINTIDHGLQITHLQPGNNWKVAASCDRQAVSRVVLGRDGKTLKESQAPGAADWPAAKQTPLLTVWRRVYAEIDRMDAPVLNVGAGQSKFDNGVATRVAARQVQLTLGGSGQIVASQTNQFQGGTLELLRADNTSLGRFDVTANTTGAMPMLTTTQNVPATTARFKDLIDDDINNASQNKVDSSDKMAPDTSLWASRLEPGLVIPVFDQPEVMVKNGNTISFDVHVGDDTTNAAERAAIKALVGKNKGSTSEPDFWVVYQLGGFQGRVDEENDPDISPSTAGVSSVFSQPGADRQAGTIVYAEAERDQPENDAATTISVANLKPISSIHEIGHEFGMTDGPTHGALMHGAMIFVANAPARVNALQFNGNGLRKIMLTTQPGHDPQ